MCEKLKSYLRVLSSSLSWCRSGSQPISICQWLLPLQVVTVSRVGNYSFGTWRCVQHPAVAGVNT